MSRRNVSLEPGLGRRRLGLRGGSRSSIKGGDGPGTALGRTGSKVQGAAEATGLGRAVVSWFPALSECRARGEAEVRDTVMSAKA